MTITTEVQDITPTIAHTWLTAPEHAARNRSLRRTKLAMLVQEMEQDRWQMTGEAIKFDKEGKLLDGQHRLKAVVISGVTVPMMIIRGLEPESQNVMDTGSARTAGDVLSINGIGNSTAVAASARILVAYYSQSITSGSRSLAASNDEILDFAVMHPQLADLASQCGSDYSKIPAASSVLLAATFIIANRDKDGAHDFINRLAKGNDLSEGNPILTLREKLYLISSNRERHSIYTMLSVILRTYAAWSQGQKLTRVILYGRNNEPMGIPYYSMSEK